MLHVRRNLLDQLQRTRIMTRDPALRNPSGAVRFGVPLSAQTLRRQVERARKG